MCAAHLEINRHSSYTCCPSICALCVCEPAPCKLFMILGIFWGKYIQKPLNRKTESWKRNRLFWTWDMRRKKMTFGDKVKNEFMYLDEKRRWNANQTIWRKERERGWGKRQSNSIDDRRGARYREREREMERAREGGISLRGDVFVLYLSPSLSVVHSLIHTLHPHIFDRHTQHVDTF